MGLRNLGTLIILLVIFMMLMPNRMRDVGGDLAAAIRNFRKGLQDDPTEEKKEVKEISEGTK